MPSLDLMILRTAPSRATALAFPERDVTWGELHSLVEERLSTWPRRRTLIALRCRADLEGLVAFYAALFAGVPTLLLHPRWPEARIQSLLEQTGAETVVDGETERELSPPSSRPSPHPDAVLLIPTSGSTGTPKVVQHSRATLEAAAEASATNLGWMPEDRWLLSLPFSHVGGVSVLVRCLLAQVPVVVDTGSFKDADLLKRADQKGATLYSLVPTQLYDLIGLRQQTPDLPRELRMVLVGGAPAPLPLRQAAYDAGLRVIYTYGMSEAGSQLVTQEPDVAQVRPQSIDVGRPLSQVELRVDESERLWVRGPNLMLGYLSKDSSPASGFEPDGWFKTSDRGEVLSDGTVRLLGRVDHVLISGGENVDPEAVEQELCRCPGIREAALFGAPDERWGTRLVAALVSDEPPERLRPHLEEFCRENLPAYAIPKQWVFLRELPQLGIGKLDRKALPQMLEPLLSSASTTVVV